ncbi:MOB kinase activator 1B-like isoform X4 [Chanodichthys erythropterus]|uniref:MOB kinase activator 1B-like isoform X4 n=1 Tax=Chanodichthys erythropterus TaxID=933992 RepID=UPI00351E4428
MSFLFGNRSSKTFKPKKNIPEGSHQYELLKHAEATLGSGNLRMAVMLPDGEDLNEWVAVNTVDFFNQINMLYGTITDFCSEDSCPVMSAGPKYEYHWADGTNIKKPIKCSAPKYIDYLMTWVQDQLDDETLFPSKIDCSRSPGTQFLPGNFLQQPTSIPKTPRTTTTESESPQWFVLFPNYNFQIINSPFSLFLFKNLFYPHKLIFKSLKSQIFQFFLFPSLPNFTKSHLLLIPHKI